MKTNSLKLNNFSLAFGDNVLFKNLDYEFLPGIYIFSGPSGVGKSSLMRCIAGLNTDYSGSIILNDEIMTGTTPKIHMVHQHYTSFPWLDIVANTLMVFKGHKVKVTKDTKKYAKEVLIQLGLEEHLKKKPHQLSGGQNQRVSIASALINNMSPVILYDEMTSALDEKNSYRVVNLIKEHQRQNQNIVIVITHEAHVAKALGGTRVEFTEKWRIR